MSNEKKNPVFWCFIAFILGIGLGIWGLIKEDCNSSPDCYVGSGLLLWTSVILIIGGLAGWAILSNRKNNR